MKQLVKETYIGWCKSTGQYVVVFMVDEDKEWYIQFWDELHNKIAIEQINDAEAWGYINDNS